MTRQSSSRAYIFVVVALFLAALTFIVPLTALAQEMDATAVITSDGLLPVVAYPSGGPRAWMLVVRPHVFATASRSGLFSASS